MPGHQIAGERAVAVVQPQHLHLGREDGLSQARDITTFIGGTAVEKIRCDVSTKCFVESVSDVFLSQ